MRSGAITGVAFRLSRVWYFQINSPVCEFRQYRFPSADGKYTRSSSMEGWPGQLVPPHGSLCSRPEIDMVSNSQTTRSGSVDHGPVPKKFREELPSHIGTDEGGFGGGTIGFASVSLTIFPPQADTRHAASRGSDRRKLWVKDREEFMGGNKCGRIFRFQPTTRRYRLLQRSR